MSQKLNREHKAMIRSWIKAALGPNLTLEDLAAQAQLHPRTLRDFVNQDMDSAYSIKTLIRRLQNPLKKLGLWDGSFDDLHKDQWGTGSVKARKYIRI